MEKYRKFLKANFVELDNVKTDQMLNKPQPEIQKEVTEKDIIVKLPNPDKKTLKERDIFNLIKSRESRRKYKNEPVSINEISLILWATQGVRKIIYRKNGDPITMRMVPSGGARQPFETYIIANNVDELKKGVYRYQPIEHQLVFVYDHSGNEQLLLDSAHGQRFASEAPVLIMWSIIPYKGEWRYHKAAHKTMLLDAGHLCQNLYLICESLNLGTCAIAAYDQEKSDRFLKLDGNEEFVVYMAPIGKV